MYSGNEPLNFSQYYNIIYLGLASKPVWFQSTVGWPELNFGHLWFIEHLLVYSLIYWLGRKVFLRNEKRAANAPGFKFLLLLAFFIALISAIVREWYPIDKWIGILGIIQTEAAHLPQYAVLFITGVFAYRYNLFLRISKKVGYISLLFGVIMALTIYVSRMFLPFMSLIYSQFAIYESFMAVFLCWGLIVLFRENYNSTSSPASFLAEHSFAAYIFHFPIVLALQYSLDRIVIFGVLGKFITVSLLAVVITYAFCFFFRKLPYVSRVI
jgi:peptidoglycan/LPS O-acetylase OafA/YrhL